MTTTEKRLGDIADRLDVIAKAIGKLTKERTQSAPVATQRRESDYYGIPITLYVCGNCGSSVERTDCYCRMCGRKLIFPQEETEAEHAAD